jgi:3-oxoacyl-[acyl-carrier protein] reductase
MDLGLKSKVVLVTGASKGIGKAVAIEFAREGADLAICARQKGPVEETAAFLRDLGARVVSATVDVTQQEQVEAFVNKVVETYGKIDVLVNSAVNTKAGTFMQSSNEDWRKLFEVEILGVVNCCRAVIPQMQKRQWGRIINISSRQGIEPTGPYFIRDGALKAALGNLTKSLSTAVAKDGITINCVSPGMIETPLHSDPGALLDQLVTITGRTRKELLDDMAAKIPAGRVGTVEDVAPAVVFLASDKASYFAGANIVMDGGVRAGWM